MYVQDDEPNDEGPGTEDEDEDNTDVDMDDDDASFASVDELDSAPLERIFLSPFAHDLNYVDEGAAHMLELPSFTSICRSTIVTSWNST